MKKQKRMVRMGILKISQRGGGKRKKTNGWRSTVTGGEEGDFPLVDCIALEEEEDLAEL